MENADSHSGWRFKFLTHEEAAARIGCSPAQLRHLRLKGEITYFRFRPVLYDQADVDEFIARRDEARQLREAERERRKKAPQPELTEQEKLEAERRLWLHKTLWKIKLAQMRNAEKRAAAPFYTPFSSANAFLRLGGS